MEGIAINDKTPVASCTLGELVDFMIKAINGNPDVQLRSRAEIQREEATELFPAEREQAFLKRTGIAVGLDEMALHFGVSRSTIKGWKKGFLAPAITKKGKFLTMNIEKANQLYKTWKMSETGHS